MLDDAFDLTPELKAEAQAEMKKYRLGPIYSPPSLQGTWMRPGVIGGANWGGGALDPETGILYVKSSNTPAIARLKKVEKPVTGELEADYVGEQLNTTFHNGLPLLKPPYGHLTAIDLNKGEILWQVPFGDDARLREHPALKGVKLPERLGAAGAMGAIVTKAGIIFCGGHADDVPDQRGEADGHHCVGHGARGDVNGVRDKLNSDCHSSSAQPVRASITAPAGSARGARLP
jgi:quinoprotein glucose dehydrogenase